MELGQYELQIFVSLTVILGAACVALICDFLKGNNEQLRELVIELKVRRDEDSRRVQPSAPAVRIPQAVESVKPMDQAKPKEHIAEPPAAPPARRRKINAEALAAMERGAALASSGGRPRSAEPVAADAKPASRPVEAASKAEAPKSAASPVKKDWSAILSRTGAERPRAGRDLLAAVVAATNSAASPAGISLPEGFQDGYVLHQLVQSHQPVSGLVVSIGINAGRNADGSRPEAVNEVIQSLIGPHDFAAQSGADEYLLIYPEEHGASAQRRLSQIAQQLWDFQIRSLGSIEILFSWGGLEVQSESIEEAIASASERMRETKRGRKLLTMPAQVQAGEQQLRRAV
ncbi:MAG TPA: hypothetical protein VMT15_17610 [Bryobacteraceae bacterium]|nr:hypothetical protein [Bryobacteraceae bacterium]